MEKVPSMPQSAMFLTPVADDEEPPMNVKFRPDRKAKVPQQFQHLKEAGIGTRQPEPVFVGELNIDMFKPNENENENVQFL